MFFLWFQEVGKSLQTWLNVRHHLGVDGFWTFPCLVCFILSGLVLVTDAITAMGLPPGRHTLGQQVIEIQGLHAYVAGLTFLRRYYPTGRGFLSDAAGSSKRSKINRSRDGFMCKTL